MVPYYWLRPAVQLSFSHNVIKNATEYLINSLDLKLKIKGFTFTLFYNQYLIQDLERRCKDYIEIHKDTVIKEEKIQ